MYFPYMRGKQYELISLRDTAKKIAGAHIIPIVTPVRDQTTGLKKALITMRDEGVEIIVVLNPELGALTNNTDPITKLLECEELKDYRGITAGILLDSNVDSNDAIRLYNKFESKSIAFIHSGFDDENELAEKLTGLTRTTHHIFLDDKSGKIYQKKFMAANRSLLRDGFKRQKRNSDYGQSEFFSDLHITYDAEGMDGFGDFLTVGEDFSDKGGGPAYTVAIHLTYMNSKKDNTMYIRHFLSDDQDSPINPGGKFYQALSKLIEFLDSDDGKDVYDTSAISEFRDLYSRKHYPGLGYVKKLSMNHHIETLANFIQTNSTTSK